MHFGIFGLICGNIIGFRCAPTKSVRDELPAADQLKGLDFSIRIIFAVRPVLRLDDLDYARIDGEIQPCLIHGGLSAAPEVSLLVLLYGDDRHPLIELIPYPADVCLDLVFFAG